MSKYSRIVDDQIRRAMESGEFDDLPGKGKPLKLEENPHEDPAWRIAYQVLRSGGYTLPWIQARHEIESLFETACASLRRTWLWRSALLNKGQSGSLVEDEWHKALNSFQERIVELNDRIFSYNLAVPSKQFQLKKIKLQEEIERITGQA
jgi:DnaJ family protein C protein 28